MTKAEALRAAQAKVASGSGKASAILEGMGLPTGGRKLATAARDLEQDVEGRQKALVQAQKELADVQREQAQSTIIGATPSEMIEMAGRVKELESRIAGLRAYLGPISTASAKLRDLAREIDAAQKEEAEATESITAAYLERQKIESARDINRTRLGTLQTTSATSQLEAETKATADIQTANRAKIEREIATNAAELPTATGARRDALGRRQAQLTAERFQIDLATEADPQARAQLAAQARQQGFAVTGNRVAPTAAAPPERPIAAPADITTNASAAIAAAQAATAEINRMTAAQAAANRAQAEALRRLAADRERANKLLEDINNSILYGQP
mgnify:CR=1 FL=1